MFNCFDYCCCSEPIKLSATIDQDVHKEVHTHKEAKRRMARQEAKLLKNQHLREEVKEAFEDAEEEEKAGDYADYHRRRKLQLEEVQVAVVYY